MVKHEMAYLERLEIERSCEELSVAYARHVDFGEYKSVANLFAEDGLLDAGGPLNGRNEILEGFGKRTPKLRSRHVLTNIHTEIIDTNNAKGISYLSLYRHIGEESLEDEPIEFDGPAAVGHYSDLFQRTAEGWRFRSRILTMSFKHSKHFQRKQK